MAREMKDSGVKWIGEIPKDWSVVQLKRHSKVVSGKEVPVELDADDSRAIPVYGSGGIFKYTDRIQYNGEVVMFGRKGTIGKPLYVNDKFWAVDTMYFLLHNKNHLSPKYNFYQLSAFNWDFYTTQTALPSIVASEVLDSKFPLPPLSEQKAIADFLDKKCAEIDGLLADLETEVKTLAEYKKSIIAETVTRGLNPNAPMKQSGIPWAETIPAHWDIQKGKYTFRLLQRPVKEDDGVITCFRDGEVTLRSNRREDGFTMSAKEYGYQGIEPGDIVVHGMDGFAGSIGISDSRGKGTPVLNVLDSKYNKRYLMYYLRNMAYGDVFLALSTGIRVRSCDLGWKKLGEICIVLPPIEEQEKIADYIDHKLDEIQKAIVNKTQQIETLKAYKSSLIYEYVTGKKQVI